MLIVTAFAWRPEILVPDEPVPVECREIAGVHVCLHAAHSPAWPQVEGVINGLQGAGLRGALREMSDHEAVNWDRPREGEAFFSIPRGPFADNFVYSSVEEGIIDNVVAGVVTGGCIGRKDVSQESYGIARDLYGRVLELAGYPNLGNEYYYTGTKKMDARYIERLMAERGDKIRDCSISIGDLP